MILKKTCENTTSMDNFSSAPEANLLEAKGDAVAVLSADKVLFYAVPAGLFEDMTDFCEMAQRGTLELNSVSGRFSLDEDPKEFTGKLAKSMQREPEKDDFTEC